MTQMRFDGRVALITGACCGLGRAYAELLAARGATVVVNDLAPDCVDRAEGTLPEPAVLATIRNSGGKAEVIYADLGAEASSRDLAREAIDRFGRVDIFIHNAGTATGTLNHLDLHLRGAVWAMHELWPRMVTGNSGAC